MCCTLARPSAAPGAGIGRHQVTHARHCLEEAALEGWGEGHPLLDTIQDQQRVRRAYAIDVLDQQTLSRYLEHVRWLHAAGERLLLYRDQRWARAQQVVRARRIR